MNRKQKVFRPSLDDVERISLGKGARKRGTGSRYVCHRLNQDERQLYDQAKHKNYLIVRGTAYRRRRKGSPVCNTFRQRCDALEQICIIIEKHSSGDIIKIDFSTLRMGDDAAHVSRIWNLMVEKHPDLMENAKDCCRDATIDWEAVQNNSIWGVNERLLVIECVHDRAAAKELAEAVLKESLKFCDEDLKSNMLEIKCAELDNDGKADGTASFDTAEIDNEADGEIDWNDI